MRSFEYLSSDLYSEFFHVWTMPTFLLFVRWYIQFNSNTTIITCVRLSGRSADSDSAVETVIWGKKGALQLGSCRTGAIPVETSNWCTGLQCLRFIHVIISCISTCKAPSNRERKSLLKLTLEFLLRIKKVIVYFI